MNALSERRHDLRAVGAIACQVAAAARTGDGER
jgi:hypothetical protein